MASSAPPSYELDRLSALQSYAILDTGAEEAFDQLAALAAHAADCVVALHQKTEDTSVAPAAVIA